MKIVISSAANTDAATVKEKIDLLATRITELQNYIDGIPVFWMGADADSFIAKYQEAITVLKKFQRDFYEYYDFLSKIYGIYEALDSSYDYSISTD